MTARSVIEIIGWKPEVPGWDLGDFDEPNWWDLALCAETDPEIFFPEKGGTTRPAKRVCRMCEVRAECLEDALAHNEGFGVRGGLSERERNRMKPPAPPRDPAYCLSGRHLKTPEGTGGDGTCLACKRERAAATAKAKRTGIPSPQSGGRLAA
jgi:WhiB family redox-sensing transcriptional regulator